MFIVADILNALRAHDSRFNAMINKIDLNNDTEGKIIIDTPPDRDGGDVAVQQLTLHFDDWKNALLAKIVEKVGDRHYWETWGKDVAEIAERHTTRINELIETDESHKKDFEKFLSSLHKNINPSVTREGAIDMLAQHLITRPVFEALFGSNEFIEKNFVSKSMQKMLSRLD